MKNDNANGITTSYMFFKYFINISGDILKCIN